MISIKQGKKFGVPRVYEILWKTLTLGTPGTFLYTPAYFQTENEPGKSNYSGSKYRVYYNPEPF